MFLFYRDPQQEKCEIAWETATQETLFVSCVCVSCDIHAESELMVAGMLKQIYEYKQLAYNSVVLAQERAFSVCQ